MTDGAEVIGDFYRAIAAQDFQSALAVLDPAVTVWQTEQLPWGGSYDGLDGFIEFFGKIRETITSAVETEEIFEAGEHVVQRGRTRGTLNATGASFDVREIHVWEVRDGKAVSLRAHIDTPAMLALGFNFSLMVLLTPQPPTAGTTNSSNANRLIIKSSRRLYPDPG